MAQQKINYGAAPNDGTGDLYRVAMIKIDNNFTDLYTNKVDKTVTIALSGGATGTATALNGAAVVIPVTGLNMGNATAGTLAVARGGTGVTSSTGTGANVQAVSPALTGTPTAPTASNTSESTQLATTAFVRNALKAQGFSDIFGQDVRYVNSTATAVAPYDNCDTFPAGTQVLATRSFVSNFPPLGDSLMYFETIASYRAANGRLQLGWGYTTGDMWVRAAGNSNNAYQPWRRLMTTDGASMTGDLNVLNQGKEENSTKAASTNFVHASYQYYGVNQASVEAKSSIRLTEDGQPATDDFNLMVGTLNGGTYTVSGSYLNGPNGAAATSYTAVLHIVRRAFNAGPAVVQWFYGTEQGGGIVTAFVRSGAFVSGAWSWGVWRKLAFETSNVASATKLRVARNITVGNTTKSFDGTGDISFSGAEIGVTGPNLLYNTDFLTGYTSSGTPNYWTVGGSATSRTGVMVPYRPYADSKIVRNALRLACVSSTDGQSIESVTDTATGKIDVVPGTAYTLSTKFRASALAEYRTFIQFRNASRAVTATITLPMIVATGDWQTSSMTGIAPANSVDANIYIGRLTKVASSPSAMWLEIAEPQFQEGAVATPYVPGLNIASLGRSGGLLTGTDWNTLLIDGDFQTWNTMPTSYTNAPSTSFKGMLRVRRSDARVYQEYLTDTVPYVSWVRYSADRGSTWTAWGSTGTDLGVAYGNGQVAVTSSDGTNATISEAATTQAGVMSAASKVKLDGIENNATKDWTGTAISTNGLDLNSFTGQGAYFCSAIAVSATLLNNPTTKAFSLNVYATAGCVQYLTEYASASNAANRMWVRGMYSNTWSAWQEVVTSLRPQLTTTTDPAGTNNTNIASTAFVQAATSGVLGLGGLTGGTRTLTAAECNNEVFVLSGALTSNLIVQIPNGINRQWIVSNITTGAFTVTLSSVTLGNTVVVPQGQRLTVFQNTPNIEEADTRIIPVTRGGTGATTSTGTGSVVLSASPALTGNPTATTQTQQDNSTRLATTAYVKRDVYTPNDIIEQRRGLVGSGNWMQTWGWNTKKASFALEMTPDEELQLISVDKEAGTGLRYLVRWNLAGVMDVPTYMQGRLENNQWAPAVSQKLNIGGAWASWANAGGIPVIQVDASDRNSAYMLWRATRWGFAHLAAMHFHESAGTNQMVSMSMRGGSGGNQHRWYSTGGYECDGSVTAAGVVLTSDQRLKNIHGKITSALDTNRKLAKVMFSFKLTGGYTAGYIAQSVKKHAPWAVSERNAQPHEKELAGDKVLTVDYQALSVNTAAAVAELEAIVAQQRKELDELKALLLERLKA